MDRISLTDADKEAGSPKAGDMIARNPKNYDDQWLVSAQYFTDNFEPVSYPPRITQPLPSASSQQRGGSDAAS
jgi:hypothetical protein